MEQSVNKPEAVEMPEDAWESGKLGRDAAYVERASPELKEEIQGALELQMISLRLQKALIAEFKLIAEYRGIGYQPLMRDVLARFARAEIMQIASELRDQQRARETIQADQAERKTA